MGGRGIERRVLVTREGYDEDGVYKMGCSRLDRFRRGSRQ
jgi:hypothetical protein